MALEYRVLELGDEAGVSWQRSPVWEDAARLAAKPVRTIDIIGTDETVDRHNTKILVDGWDLRDFQNNPVLLWSHNMDPAVSTMPVGRIIGVYKEVGTRADKKLAKRLVFRTEFPAEGTYPFADLVYKMYESKFLRASSVGFRNIKLRRLDPSDDEDKKLIAEEGFDAKHPYGAAILEKNALMELSAVPVGSNPNALAKGLREATPVELRGLVDAPEGGVEVDETWIRERFEALRVALSVVPEEESTDEVSVQIETEVSPEIVETKDVAIKIQGESLDEFVAKIAAKMIATSIDALRSDFQKVFSELEGVRQLVTHISTQVADLSGAERVAGDEPIAPAKADPLDVILGENADQLRRISSLLQ